MQYPAESLLIEGKRRERAVRGLALAEDLSLPCALRLDASALSPMGIPEIDVILDFQQLD